MVEILSRFGTPTHSLHAWIKRYDKQQHKFIERMI
nr:hypothetical protein [Acinetobacter junii]